MSVEITDQITRDLFAALGAILYVYCGVHTKKDATAGEIAATAYDIAGCLMAERKRRMEENS